MLINHCELGKNSSCEEEEEDNEEINLEIDTIQEPVEVREIPAE